MIKIKQALALSLGITLILAGSLSIKYPSLNNKKEVMGVSTMQLDEDTSARKIADPDKLLVDLGRTSGLNIIEIYDSSFPWITPHNTFEVLGKSISINNFSQNTWAKIIGLLEEMDFQPVELNTYVSDNKNNNGYTDGFTVCLLHVIEKENDGAQAQIIEKILEIKCGVPDPARIKNLELN